MKYKKLFFLWCVCFIASACAQTTGIFPSVNLSTTESSAQFANPISLAVDETNSQIIVVNSNVDMLFDQGSIAVLSVDASDTDAPVLSAEKIVAVPNFAGEVNFDGTSSLYVPFRESSSTSSSVDILNKYTVSASDIVETLTGTVSSDPFGISSASNEIYTVSDDVLEIYNTDLTLLDSVDLTSAEDADIEDANAHDVLSVAVDSSTGFIVVSNPSGKMFIVDRAAAEVMQVISGPLSTRNVLIDSQSRLFAIDALTQSVWVFDLTKLPLATSAPESVDDSRFLITSIGVGNSPYGMALDESRHRLYVGNYNDASVSVIDTINFQEVDRISLDGEDISASFQRDCEGPIALQTGTFNSVPYVFVACFLSHDVVTINAATLSVVDVFPNSER